MAPEPVRVVLHNGRLCTRVPSDHYIPRYVPVTDDGTWLGPVQPPILIPPPNHTGP